MDLAHRIVWLLGLISMAYANAGTCLRCSLAPLAIACLLAFGGYRQKAGILVIGGFAVPMAVGVLAPPMPWWASMTLGMALTYAAYRAIRTGRT